MTMVDVDPTADWETAEAPAPNVGAVTSPAPSPTPTPTPSPTPSADPTADWETAPAEASPGPWASRGPGTPSRFNAVVRGHTAVRNLPAQGSYILGYGDPDSMADALRDNADFKAHYPPPLPEDQKGMEEIAKAWDEGLWSTMGALVRNPSGMREMLLESTSTPMLISAGAGLGSSMAAGAVSGPAAPITGPIAFALGSAAADGAITGLSGLTEYIRENWKLDPIIDRDRVAQELAKPERRAELQEVATRRGFTQAGFTLVASRLGQSFAAPLFRKGASTRGKVGGIAGAAAVEGTIGEAAPDAVTEWWEGGTPTLGEFFTTSLLGAAPGAIPDIASAYIESRRTQGNPLTEEEEQELADEITRQYGPEVARQVAEKPRVRVRADGSWEQIGGPPISPGGGAPTVETPREEIDPEVVGGSKIVAITEKIMQLESSWDPNDPYGARSAGAQPRDVSGRLLSSALGPAQFIEKTWLDTIAEFRPDIAQSMSREDILALRTNVDLTREMMVKFTQKNAQHLESAGFSGTDPGNLYLAHFLGRYGAARLLSADPNTPLDRLLPESKIKANERVMRGKTVGDLIRWSNGLMGNVENLAAVEGPVRLGLYSAVERTLERDPTAVATGEQWLSMLRQTPGVKQEELDEVGLFFALAGKEKVTKEEALRAVRENTLEMNEIVLTDDDAEYGEYTTPGGKSYREFLITAPPSKISEDNYEDPHWPMVANPVVSLRTTNRRTQTGGIAFHLEEVQSTGHQEARKEGYRRYTFAERRAIERELLSLWPIVNSQWDFGRRESARQRLEQLQAELYDRENPTLAIPNMPFKSSWQELGLRRALKFAADWDYDALTLSPAQEHINRYGGENRDKKRSEGMRHFYDKVLPSKLSQLARRVGAEMGTEEIEALKVVWFPHNPSTGERREDLEFDTPQQVWDWVQDNVPLPPGGFINDEWAASSREVATSLRVPAIRLTPEVRARIRGEGLPLMQRGQPGVSIGRVKYPSIGPMEKRPLYETVVEAVNAADAIAKRLGIGSLRVIIHDDPTLTSVTNNGTEASTWKGLYVPATGEIHINMAFINTTMESISVVMHEFGHAVMFEKFNKMSDVTKEAVFEAWERYKEGQEAVGVTSFNIIAGQGPAGEVQHRFFSKPERFKEDPTWNEYKMSFEEWFADHVARYMMSPETPAYNIVEKAFKRLADILSGVFRTFAHVFPNFDLNPDQAVRDWLDSVIGGGVAQGAYDRVKAANRYMTWLKNRRMLDSAGMQTFPAAPLSMASVPGRQVLAQVDPKGVDPKVAAKTAAMPAVVDKMSKRSATMLTIYQIAEQNPYVQSLQHYVQRVKLAVQELNLMLQDAGDSMKQWERLGPKGQDRLTGFIDDFIRMAWLSDAERLARSTRAPNNAEVLALVQKHKLTTEEREMFRKFQSDFSKMLDKFDQVIRQRIQTDPLLKPGVPNTEDMKRVQAQLDAHDRQMAELRSQPFFPTANFGKYTITVRTSTGDVTAFYTFDSERQMKSNLARIQKDLDQNSLVGEKAYTGIFTQHHQSFAGMPAQFLSSLKDKLSLSPEQHVALDELIAQRLPHQSWRVHFRLRKQVEGYSQDFIRSYAHFMFHASTHITRMKYQAEMAKDISMVDNEAKSMEHGVNRGRIKEAMQEHFEEFVDPRSEWQWTSGLTFMMHLGWNVASAAVNLTQILTSGYPYLANAFGDISSAGAIAKSSADWKRYMKRGTVEGFGRGLGANAGFVYQAIGIGIDRGTITEAMAPEVVGVASGKGVFNRIGSNPGVKQVKWFMENSGFLFGLTEQFGRRAVFSAALELALKNHNPKGWLEIEARHSMLHESLKTSEVSKDWTPQQRRAYIIATDAVERSFYIYNRTARPKFMRGIGRPFWAFKTYLHNELYQMWNYPGIGARKVVMLAILAGGMGIPGMEDAEDILRAFAHTALGKDFRLEAELRKFLYDTFESPEVADALLHGVTRNGMGLGHLMEFAGFHNPPVPDISGSVGMGKIIPFPISPFVVPSANPQAEAMRGLQQASGATFGLLFDALKFLGMGDQSGDGFLAFKRFEHLLPRAFENVSKTWRIWEDEGIVLQNGAKVLPFNLDDPNHMAELAWKSIGFQPVRLTRSWDATSDTSKRIQYIDAQRRVLLGQLAEAKRQDDTDTIAEVRTQIRDFNANLGPNEQGKRITRKVEQASWKARERSRKAIERGSDPIKANRPIREEIRRMYPGQEIISSQPVR